MTSALAAPTRAEARDCLPLVLAALTIACGSIVPKIRDASRNGQMLVVTSTTSHTAASAVLFAVVLRRD
jgi:hypothetical protein